MHLELVVPALLQARTPLPALELLLARGRRRDAGPATLEDWYARAFALEDALPAGALTALAAGLDATQGAWLRADPVHLRADRDRAVLVPSAAFALDEAEAAALAAALHRHFAADFDLHVVRPDVWCLRPCGAAPPPAGARAPIELAGEDVDAALPDKRWHALLNEIQMALYQDGANTAREARGAPVVNSVWLWGSGPLPPAASAPWSSVSAEDAVALGLARLAQARHRSPGPDAIAWLERAPIEGRHLVVLDELRAPRALGDTEALERLAHRLESDWFAPVLDALRADRVGMVTVHVPDAGLAFETVRGDLRRFWRRARALSAYAARERA